MRLDSFNSIQENLDKIKWKIKLANIGKLKTPGNMEKVLRSNHIVGRGEGDERGDVHLAGSILLLAR